MSGAPVGIFDSGVGGLSVAREIRAELPGESILYLADTAYCPYGGRPTDEITARSVAAVGELVRRRAKAVVVACNTATGAALERLRAEFGVPIVGLEPAVKPAVQASRNGRVGVMATAATLRSDRFHRLIDTFARDVEVVAQACPGLVEVVEAGDTGSPRAEALLTELLAPFREAQVDTVVLGCTHYPFLRDTVAAIMGPSVRVLDSGHAVARHLARVLREGDLLAPEGNAGIRVFTTADPASVAAVVQRLWGEPIDVEYTTLQEPG